MKKLLDDAYQRYTSMKYIDPDPLMYIYRFDDPKDREIAGFIASQFALGRVASILKFLDELFESFPSPYNDLLSGNGIKRWELKGPHYYRFYKAHDIKQFFNSIMQILKSYGSLENAFAEGYSESGDVWSGLESLAHIFIQNKTKLVSNPIGGSACKRLHLFLRWMVRNDAVDPGIWSNVRKSDLQYPVDTHILQIATKMGITKRKQSDKKTVAEITEYFSHISPDDPVKYDFCLSRLGIHPDLNYSLLYQAAQNKAKLYNRSA